MLMSVNIHKLHTIPFTQLAINYSKCSTYSSPKWKQNDIYWVNIWTYFFFSTFFFFFILSTFILWPWMFEMQFFFYCHPDGDLFYSIDFRVNYWRSTFKFLFISFRPRYWEIGLRECEKYISNAWKHGVCVFCLLWLSYE